MLAIPSSSDACERLFSSAKLLLNDQRSRLKMDIIEANECLRSWFGPPGMKAFDPEEEAIAQEVVDGEVVDNEGGESAVLGETENAVSDSNKVPDDGKDPEDHGSEGEEVEESDIEDGDSEDNEENDTEEE